ncbi:unnamed protein product [Brassica rapa]|uniref:THO1-MOS11 C-terminal domain-containing protein n=1 Tax=Brassica campestris TaxID=3711 RepID=A0A8D9H1Q0_BRACM|nr:unnamed protein product [Brassica rapa]
MASNGVAVENVSGEIPKKIVDLNIAEPDEILDGEVKESTGEKKDGSDSKSAGDVSPVDDVQKKIRRAERFGVSVKLTEEEKRNSRAERFGTVAAVKDSQGTKKKAEEDLKRKARADRFGVPAKVDNTEEEAKKKARLARFGKDTKVDSAEDDKRKARALRFSKPASEASADLPGKLDISKVNPPLTLCFLLLPCIRF